MEHETERPFPESTTGEASDRLKHQARAVREDLRDLGQAARDAAQEKLEEARRGAAAYYDDKKEKAVELEDQVVEYVRRQPVKSVLIAAGVGLLLGAVWSRR